MKFGIFATDLAGGIGKDGKLPWHFSEDMAFFKNTTSGSLCVMGRHTHDEIFEMRKDKKTLLPNRICVVLTTNKIDKHADTLLVHSKNELEEFLAETELPIFLTGGKTIFENAMIDPSVNGFYVTNIKGTYDCDVYIDRTGLNTYFECVEVILENENLRIEKWLRK